MTQPPNNIPTYIVDTHPLLWHLIKDKKLSKIARLIIEQAEIGQVNLIIPAVVLAEIFMIAEKQRTALVLSTLQTAVQE